MLSSASCFRRAKVKEEQPDRGEENVWGPGCCPCRDAIALPEGEKEMREEIHGEDQANGSRDTRENAGAGEADRKRRREKNDDETGPRQSDAVLEMRGKRRKQWLRKIGIEAQIIAKLR